LNKKWTLLFALLFLSLTLVLAGCNDEEAATDEEDTNDNGEDAADENDEAAAETGDNFLIYNNGSEPTSLDPPIGNDQYSYDILNNMSEGLTRLGRDEPIPEPGMAEDWEVSDDATEYTFYLREDIYWTNGEPVTAEDFEFSWKRLADPETASPAAEHSYWIKGAEAFNEGEGSADDMIVEAIDEKTLYVEMENPTDFFPSITAMPQLFPAHKDTVEADESWAGSIDTIVSNGPFKMTEWAHDEYIVLEKNEDYWDADSVQLDGIEFLMIEENTTAYQLYESDEMHALDVGADMIDEFLERGEVEPEPRAGIEFQRFAVDQEPFQNKKIRQAFNHAIDKELIVENITSGEPVAGGFVSYGYLDADENDFRETAGNFYEYDPERARELLEEGMAEEGYDELPTVTLFYNTDETHSTVAQAVQELLYENLDIDIELDNTEWAVFLEAQQNVELQYSRSSFLGGYNDPINFLANFQSGHSMNRTGWGNEEYDELIAASYQEEDPHARFELLYEAEEILMEEAPFIPLYYYTHTFAYKPEVSGVVRHPVGFVDLKTASLN
jgi:dipeptide transport system substrate-binding protein